MTDETRNTIIVICTVGALAIQFWALRKPVETKIAILWWLAELSGTAAIVAAAYFLMTSDNSTLPSACVFYNFLVQGALFIISPRPADRKDILSIVFAAVLFATIPMIAATNALSKTQTLIAKLQSEMVKTDAKTVSILEKVSQILAIPSPSPSPSPYTP